MSFTRYRPSLRDFQNGLQPIPNTLTEFETSRDSKDHPILRPLPTTVTAMSHSAALDEILHRSEIVETIFSVLSPANAMRFSRVARVTRDVMKIQNATTYNIHRLLRTFFNDVVGFRCLQARTRTLISGSNALNLFDRMRYRDFDLDLYTHPGNAREVGLWLIAEGYEFQPVSDNAPQNFLECRFDAWRPWETSRGDAHHIPGFDDELESGLSPVRDIHRFVRERAGEKREIKIMASVQNPMQCILGFNSSESTLMCHCRCSTRVSKLAL